MQNSTFNVNPENSQSKEIRPILDAYKVSRTRDVPNPTKYITWLLNDFSEWAIDEERAPKLKSKWREDMGADSTAPLDLEVGVGNGFFFADYVKRNPQRLLVGLELKYKPLMQTVKRALAAGGKKFRVARYNAHYLTDLFEVGELDNVFIYFPDPWALKSQLKHRLLKTEFWNNLFELQKAGSIVEFKTDHPEYFEWVLERLPHTKYRISRQTFDLHNSEYAKDNVMTHFEKLWTGKGLKTHMVRLERD